MDVALFVTCLTDTFYPQVGAAVVRVLRHFGCRVHFPKAQTCCGQPAYNSGFHSEAAALVERTAHVFDGYDRVVTPSASCATMLRQHGPALRPHDERVAALADKTWEFHTFLRDQLGADIARHVQIAEPVTFHYPCHAREVYSLDDLLGWLRGATDLRTPARPDLCCGFGGVFAVDYPELSGAMLNDKLDQLAATGAELVISNEAACTMQLAGGAHRRGLPLRFRHLAEVLAATTVGEAVA